MTPIVIKQTVIPFKDLSFLSISCANCKTEIILDVSRVPREGNPNSITPAQCPSCTLPFDSAIRQHVDTFRTVYAGLSRVEGVNFRVSIEEPDTMSAPFPFSR
jgi:hypothetical protein